MMTSPLVSWPWWTISSQCRAYLQHTRSMPSEFSLMCCWEQSWPFLGTERAVEHARKGSGNARKGSETTGKGSAKFLPPG